MQSIALDDYFFRIKFVTKQTDHLLIGRKLFFQLGVLRGVEEIGFKVFVHHID